MRSAIVIAATISLAAGASFAQYANPPGTPGTATLPQTQSEPAAPSNAARSAIPDAGPALTETQAKSRIEAQGYSRVSELKKDAKGEWNAKAMKDGKPVQLSLDTQGHIAVLN